MNNTYRREMARQFKQDITELECVERQAPFAVELYMPIMALRLKHMRSRIPGIIADRRAILDRHTTETDAQAIVTAERTALVATLLPSELLLGRRSKVGLSLLLNGIRPHISPLSTQAIDERVKEDASPSTTMGSSDAGTSSPITEASSPLAGYTVAEEVSCQLPQLPMRSYVRVMPSFGDEATPAEAQPTPGLETPQRVECWVDSISADELAETQSVYSEKAEPTKDFSARIWNAIVADPLPEYKLDEVSEVETPQYLDDYQEIQRENTLLVDTPVTSVHGESRISEAPKQVSLIRRILARTVTCGKRILPL